MVTLSLRLLGTYTVSLDGRPVETFATDKERALLVYLAVEAARPHRREELAALLWPDLPAGKARNNFRVTLHRLRQAVNHPEANPIEATSETVTLNRDVDVQVDANAVAQKLEEVRRHDDENGICSECHGRLTEAARLYGGAFLAGFSLDGSPAFNEWASLKREWHHLRVLYALDRLAQHHLRRGEIEVAQKVAHRQIELEPWRERAHRQLMRSLACAGAYSAALAQFETCRRILSEELNVEPSEQTERLYEEILVARETHFRPLPNATGRLIGREKELEQITSQLTDPACRLLTLVGPGGVGKSRLALEATRKLTMAFLHGVCFVPLTAVDSADRLMGAIARAANYTFQNRRDRRSELLGYLEKKEMLLVLDNFEHLVPERELLPALLAHAPALKVLVTSRVRLNFREENVLELQGLAVPEQDGAQEVEQIGAVRLFVERARRAQPSFELSPQSCPSVLQLCRFLSGMPLGIELASSWSRVLTPQETLSRIRDSIDFLESPAADVPDRHRSMRASFEHSWALLDDKGRDALMKFSVFRGGAGRRATSAVTGASLTTLVSLVDHTLLSRDPASGRFTVHEVIRAFSLERLEEAGEAKAAGDAHSDYYLQALAGYLPDLKGRDQLGALDAIDEDFENVRIAWKWAIRQGHWQHIPQAGQGLYLFAVFRSRYTDGIELFDTARHALTSPSTSRERLACAYALAARQALLSSLELHEEALATVRELRPVISALTDPAAVAYCQMMMGKALISQVAFGEYPAGATAALAAARAYYKQAQDPFYRAMVLWWLGAAHLRARQVEEARGSHRRALALAREAGDRFVAAAMLHNLGAGTWAQEGPSGAAGNYFKQAANLFREVGARAFYGFSLALLGLVQVWRKGDLAKSGPMLEEAWAIAAEQNSPLVRRCTLASLASHRLLEGQYEKVLVLTQEAIAVAEENTWAWSWATFQRGIAFFATGEFDNALPLLKRALSRVRHTLRQWLAVSLAYCGLVIARQGEHKRAVELFALGLSKPNYRRGLEIDPLLTRTRAELEGALGEERFAAAWERGKALDAMAVAEDVLAALEAAG